jgi:hypothetical protein
VTKGHYRKGVALAAAGDFAAAIAELEVAENRAAATGGDAVGHARPAARASVALALAVSVAAAGRGFASWDAARPSDAALIGRLTPRGRALVAAGG